jgi:cytochrome c oxidase subunit 2
MSPDAQTALQPAANAAAAVHSLWSLMFWICAVVFIAVLAILGVALARRQSEPSKAVTRSVAGATVLTVLILFGLLAASVWTSHALAAARPATAISIQVTGHQWWWEIEYEAGVPSARVLTANEIHLPVDRPVVFKVTSRDVIHSFWAPNLHGKRDLIPGYTTAIWLQPTRTGTFRAQCAEFCGLQHAHMALDVIVESEDAFNRWLSARREPAPPPSGDLQQRGQQVFMSTRCAGCHAIRGTDAGGQVGPDLTHIASRGTIAAGTLSNTPAHLNAWVTDPQAIKPGNQMPPTPLATEDMQALIAYLETLR